MATIRPADADTIHENRRSPVSAPLIPEYSSHANVDSIETLRREHRLIADVLDALERCIDLVERGDTRPLRGVARFVVFLKESVELPAAV